MKIFVINGYPQSGKDTFCKFAEENYPRVYTYSTIAKIKELALLIGWDGQKDEKGRKLLADLKKTLSKYNDVSYKETMSFIREKMEECADKYGEDANDAIFFIHCREPKDIKRFCRSYGAQSIFINRPGCDKQWSNSADNKVKEWTYNHYIDNNGSLEDLKRVACDFIESVRKENWNSYMRDQSSHEGFY